MKKLLLAVFALAWMSLLFFHHVDAQESTDVYLYITGGNITIGATGSFNFGTFSSLSTVQTAEKQFTGDGYFWVEDLKGADAGYYTTVSITDLTGQSTNDVIPADNVKIRTYTTWATLIAGDANTKVVVPDALATAYTSFSTPITFLKRDNAVNNGSIGKYAMFPWLQITIPAFVSPDTYQGVITYTLFEN